jgi:predicted ATPase
VSIQDGEPLPALCRALAGLDVLLALDNAEHLIDACAQAAAAMLAAAPGLRLLVTSQAPLRVTEEQVFRLDALAVPVDVPTAQRALEYGAVALFSERVRQADARWQLTDDNVAMVIALCRRLDGLPLAIELAAARAPYLGLRALAVALDDRLGLLGHANRLAPSRQRTLRAALDWSHSFLCENDRAVFRRMAVFAGSGPLSTILHVVADRQGALDRLAVLDALTGLVERSLIVMLPSSDHGEPRYKLLETPRLFALERLKDAGEETETRRRHAHAMADWCDRAWDEPYSGQIGVMDWQKEMQGSIPDVRLAYAWAKSAGDHTLALRLVATLLQAFLPSQAHEAMLLSQECLPWLAGQPVEIQARAAWRISRWLTRRGPDGSYSIVDAALERLGHPETAQQRWLSYALQSEMVFLLSSLGRIEDAKARLAALRAQEDVRWPSSKLYFSVEAALWLGYAAGDWSEVREHGHRLLSLSQAAGVDPTLLLANQVGWTLGEGDAAAAAQQAKSLLTALADGRNLAALHLTQLHLGAALIQLGDPSSARGYLLEAWHGHQRLDLFASTLDHVIALLCACDGRHEAAAQLIGYAIAQEVVYGAPTALERSWRDNATQLARSALGSAEFERWCAVGASLNAGSAHDLERAALFSREASGHV